MSCQEVVEVKEGENSGLFRNQWYHCKPDLERKGGIRIKGRRAGSSQRSRNREKGYYKANPQIPRSSRTRAN